MSQHEQIGQHDQNKKWSKLVNMSQHKRIGQHDKNDQNESKLTNWSTWSKWSKWVNICQHKRIGQHDQNEQNELAKDIMSQNDQNESTWVNINELVNMIKMIKIS